MKLSEINISKEQANEIAKTIFADIDDFVKEHYEEYLAFCKSEGYAVGVDFSADNVGEEKHTA